MVINSNGPILHVFKHVILPGVLLFFTTLFTQVATAQSLSREKDVIRDLDSIVTPNGIQQSYQLELGGHKQWIFERGKDRENPIILFVHGGPASPLAPIGWAFQKPLEEFFTVVHYDQRGSGKTFSSNDSTGLAGTIHIDQYVSDAIELSEHLLKKSGKRKLILAGHSWGTIVATKAALKRPDLFAVYVGIGQVIYTRDNERLSYEFGLKQAKAQNNKKAIAELESIFPYPGDKEITRERIIIARTWPQYYGGLSAYRNGSSQFFRAPSLSPLYNAKDVSAINNGSLFTLSKVLPEFMKVDLRSVTSFPVPVFMLLGRHDYTTPTLPVEQWLGKVKAPVKKAIWFEHSAHLIPIEEPGKLFLTLYNDVRPLALKTKP